MRCSHRLAGGDHHGPRQPRRQPELPARHGAALRGQPAAGQRAGALRLLRPAAQRRDQHPGPPADGGRLRPADDRRRDPAVGAARLGAVPGLGPAGRNRSTTSNGSCPARREAPPAAPDRATRSCASRNGQIPQSGRNPGQTADRQPEHLHRRSRWSRRWKCGPTRTPTTSRTDQASYPPTTECEKQAFKPVLNAALTSSEADSPSGIDMELKAAQFLGVGRDALADPQRVVTLPAGLSVNPDAADGQTACTDDQANFDSEGARRMSRHGEDRDLRDRHAGARRAAARLALHRRTQAGQPVPAPDGRLGLRDPREGRRRDSSTTR